MEVLSYENHRERGFVKDLVKKTEKFHAPIEKTKNGDYKMKSGQTVYVCFSSDFLIEDADKWRTECWEMLRLAARLKIRKTQITAWAFFQTAH